jgi:hypothetical protein
MNADEGTLIKAIRWEPKARISGSDSNSRAGFAPAALFFDLKFWR